MQRTWEARLLCADVHRRLLHHGLSLRRLRVNTGKHAVVRASALPAEPQRRQLGQAQQPPPREPDRAQQRRPAQAAAAPQQPVTHAQQRPQLLRPAEASAPVLQQKRRVRRFWHPSANAARALPRMTPRRWRAPLQAPRRCCAGHASEIRVGAKHLQKVIPHHIGSLHRVQLRRFGGCALDGQHCGGGDVVQHRVSQQVAPLLQRT